MIKKSFAENISDETFAEMVDITLRLEKAAKKRNIKNLLKIIPAAAAIVLFIGFINTNTIEYPHEINPAAEIFSGTENLNNNNNNTEPAHNSDFGQVEDFDFSELKTERIEKWLAELESLKNGEIDYIIQGFLMFKAVDGHIYAYDIDENGEIFIYAADESDNIEFSDSSTLYFHDFEGDGTATDNICINTGSGHELKWTGWHNIASFTSNSDWCFFRQEVRHLKCVHCRRVSQTEWTTVVRHHEFALIGDSGFCQRCEYYKNP